MAQVKVKAAMQQMEVATGQHAVQSLESLNPAMLEAIEAGVAAGMTPKEIRMHLLDVSHWPHWANLCFLAASYLVGQEEGEEES